VTSAQLLPNRKEMSGHQLLIFLIFFFFAFKFFFYCQNDASYITSPSVSREVFG
jgi:hypothetical protein